LRERYGLDFFPCDWAWVERATAPVRQRLSQSVLVDAWQAGRAQPIAQTIEEARTLAHEIATAASPRTSASGQLTAREAQVLRLVVEGRTNQEIADTLFVSHRTARAHVASILAKLDVPTRAAAASYAIRHDLI
jgi:DNA-binding NarL/FixJ family response regulator